MTVELYTGNNVFVADYNTIQEAVDAAQQYYNVVVTDAYVPVDTGSIFGQEVVNIFQSEISIELPTTGGVRPDFYVHDSVTQTSFFGGVSGTPLDNGSIIGSAGTNRVFTSQGSDYIELLGGDDVFFVKHGGVDFFNGGDGEDLLSYGHHNSLSGVVVQLSNITATIDNETSTIIGFENVVGTPGDDFIGGDNNDNELRSGGGNDILQGLLGDDFLFASGAPGNTVASFEMSANAVYVDLFNGAATGEGNDTLINIHGAYGSSHDDVFVANNENNTIDGRIGNDTVDYSLVANGITAQLSFGQVSGAGADDLFSIENVYGSEFDDNLIGNNQDNVFRGNGGNDFIDGGAGEDTFSFVNSGGVVNLALGIADVDGNDTLVNIENIRNDDLGASFLTGDAGNNKIWGNGGQDRIWGGLGDDYLDGGAGNHDFVQFDTAANGVTVDFNNSFATGEGTDTILNFENIIGSAFNDVLIGDGGDNDITGGDGDDNIAGFGGADILRPNVGDDHIDGGDGVDWLVLRDGASGMNINMMTGTATGWGNKTFSNIENISATDFADVIVGDDQVNHIEGHDGDDYIYASNGDDVVLAGVVPTDVDTIDFSLIGFDVFVDLTSDTALFGGFTQHVNGFKNAVGSDHNDTIYGDGADNVLLGGDGNDALEGGAGTDDLDGGAGFDSVSYSGSADGVFVNLNNHNFQMISASVGMERLANMERVIGSGFDDVLLASNSDSVLLGGTGADNLQGRGGNDTLHGGDHNDVLLGKGGNDILSGSGGDDYIRAGAGDDTIDGGAGTDTADFSDAATGFTADLDAGTVTHLSGEADTIGGIENVVGSGFEDTISGTADADNIQGRDGDDVLDGRGGNDVLTAGDGNDTVQGGDGDDKLYGNNGNDVLDGGLGDDRVAGLGGDDTMIGSTGIDRLDGGAGVDTVLYDTAINGMFINLQSRKAFYDGGAPGIQHDLILVENAVGSGLNDVIVGSTVDNNLVGGLGDDNMQGRDGNDTIDAGEGNDVVIGGAGDDNLQAGDGDDLVRAGSGDDIADGGAGIDLLDYSDVTDGVTVDLANAAAQLISAAGGTDTISGFENARASGTDSHLMGTAGANTLIGGAGNDTLNGRDGDDLLLGKDGDDWLLPGTGVDHVDGDGGFDVADFDQVADDLTIDLTVGTADDTAGLGTVDAALIEVEGALGGLGDDVVTGNATNNLVGGREGTNQIDAGDGDDVIWAGFGEDTGTGGAGFDTIDYSHVSDGSRFDIQTFASGNLITRDRPSQFIQDQMQGIEAVIGGVSHDFIRFNGAQGRIGDGFDGNDLLISKSGDDILSGGSGDDNMQNFGSSVILLGGAGNDNVTEGTTVQTGDASLLTGGAGDDVLQGGENDDALFGGAGNDTLIAGHANAGSALGNQPVPGGALNGLGTDLEAFVTSIAGAMGIVDPSQTPIDLSEGLAAVGAGYQIDAAQAGYYQSAAIGMSSSDNVATDTLSGGAGDDILLGSNETYVVMFGDEGNDLLNAERARHIALYGGDGDDTLLADENASRVMSIMDGGDGADILTGAGSDDLLIVGSNGTGIADLANGGDGDDKLVAHMGNGLSELTGGAGADMFEVHAQSQTVSVTDFTTGDDLFTLVSGGAVSDFNDLVTNYLTGADTFVVGGLSTTLVGVDIAVDLSGADFIFI